MVIAARQRHHQRLDANRHDSAVFEQMVDSIPPIRRPRGRRRKRQLKLHGDKAWDNRHRRRFLHRHRIIKVRVAR